MKSGNLQSGPALAAAADSPQTTEVTKATPKVGPRKLAGLVAGRIVNYVMADGTLRAFFVVNPWDGTGLVNGILFFDGVNDAKIHVVPLGVDSSGHVPAFAKLLASVPYSEDATPGSWHFGAKQAVVASSVDPDALLTQLIALNKSDFEKGGAVLTQQVLEVVNEKLAATVQTVNQLLDGHREFLESLASDPNPNPAAANPAGELAGSEPSAIAEGEQMANAATAAVAGETGQAASESGATQTAS